MVSPRREDKPEGARGLQRRGGDAEGRKEVVGMQGRGGGLKMRRKV